MVFNDWIVVYISAFVDPHFLMCWCFFLSASFLKQWVNRRGTSWSQKRTGWRRFLNIVLCANMCLLNLDTTAVSHFLMMCSKHSAVSIKNTFRMSYLWSGKWRLRLLCLYLSQIYVVWLMQTFKLRLKA